MRDEGEVIKMKTNVHVHVEHCCAKHGCKYSTPICPVVSGRLKQAYSCEICDWELTDGGVLEWAYLMNEMYDKGKAAAMKDVEI